MLRKSLIKQARRRQLKERHLKIQLPVFAINNFIITIRLARKMSPNYLGIKDERNEKCSRRPQNYKRDQFASLIGRQRLRNVRHLRKNLVFLHF